MPHQSAPSEGWTEYRRERWEVKKKNLNFYRAVPGVSDQVTIPQFGSAVARVRCPASPWKAPAGHSPAHVVVRVVDTDDTDLTDVHRRKI